MRSSGEKKKVVRKKAVIRLGRALKALTILVDQTAVHRRKFEYTLAQIRKFQAWYSTLDPDSIIVHPESSYMKVVMNQMQDLKQILSQYILQTWTVPTIQNHCNVVFEQLQDVFAAFHRVVERMNPDLVNYFDPNSEEFMKYHVFDLRAIAASFAAYLQRNEEDTDLMNQISLRLAEITSELAEHDKNNVTATREFSPIPVTYQQWRANINDFEIEEEIGSGLSSEVFKGTYKKTGEKVALKRFKDIKLNGTRLQFFQREVAVLAVLSKYAHPCLIKFIGATDTPPYTIITEYMTKGSLYDDVRKNHHMTPTQLTIAAYDVARGMQYLHSCQLVHRDLKSLNILLDDDYHIRICDFGFSRSIGGEETFKAQNMGTPQWMAPEILESTRHYTSKIDVYAYAILLTEILTGTTPYQNYDDMKVLKRKIIEEDIRPILPSTCTPMMRDLITQSWDRNPDVRPTFDEIVQRFEKMEIYFQGTDLNILKDHIEKSKTSHERIIQQWEIRLENLKDNKITINEFLSNLSDQKIPPSFIEKTWDIFSQIIAQNNEKKEKIPSPSLSNQMIAKMMTIFADTSKTKEAVEILRAMPKNSINEEIVMKFLNVIPTGSNDVDTSIIVLACKNNLAPLASIYSKSDSDLAFSLEVALRKPIDKRFEAALIDKCAESLITGTLHVKTAAFKMLIALNAVHRIPAQYIEAFLVSDDNKEVETLAFLASMIYPTKVAVEICLKKLNNENAKLVCLSACENDENLAKIVIDHCFDCDDKDWSAKVLAICSKYRSLSKKAADYSNTIHLDLSTPNDIKDLLSMVLSIQ